MNSLNMDTALSAVNQYPTTTSLGGAVSMKMLDNSIDMSKQMSDQMVKMMENSVNPHIGSNIDVSV